MATGRQYILQKKPIISLLRNQGSEKDKLKVSGNRSILKILSGKRDRTVIIDPVNSTKVEVFHLKLNT